MPYKGDSIIEGRHVHLNVSNREEHKKLWLSIGAQVAQAGTLEMLKFPGIFVILTQAQTTEGSEGSTVNHFGLAVKNVDEIRAKLSAAGLPTVQELTNPKRWVTMFPDKAKVEFMEDPAMTIPISIGGRAACASINGRPHHRLSFR